MNKIASCTLLLLALSAASARAQAQPRTPTQSSSQTTSQTPAPSDNGSDIESVGKSAGRIASQPARDVGVARTTIPPALQAAAADPYNMKGIRTCKDIAAAFHALTDVIGPDFKAGDTRKENRAGKLAEAGGQTVVNSLIPFRGLVREVTGAAPAQRRLNRAIEAGFARRGFLRGIHQTRKCKTTLF